MKTTPVEWLEKSLNAIRLDVDKNVLKFIDKSFEIAKEIENQQSYSEEEVALAFNEGQAYSVTGKLIDGKEWTKTHKKEWFNKFKNK